MALVRFSLLLFFSFVTWGILSIEEGASADFSTPPSVGTEAEKGDTVSKEVKEVKEVSKRQPYDTVRKLESIEDIATASAYTGRNYNVERLGKKSYDLLRLGEAGTKQERLSVLRWCGKGRVLYCFDLLKESLKNDDDDIRNEAVIALGHLGLPVGVDALIELYQNEKNIDILANLLYALGNSRAEQHLKILCENLERPEMQIRKRSLEGLAELQGISGESLTCIEKLLSTEKRARVRIEAYRTLTKLFPDDATYRERLVEFFTNPDSVVRNLAAVYSSELSITEAFLPSQRALLVESDPVVRKSLYKAYRKSRFALLLETE